MELLLAIAIVAVLVTLGVSVGSSVRMKANDTKCMAQLRQSGEAILAYLHDHNGRFLPKKYWFQYSSYRTSTTNKGMREYFQVEPDITPLDPSLWVDSMLTCPAMIRKYPTIKESQFRRGYGINYHFFTTADDKVVPSFKNIRAVPSLSEMWILTDGAVDGGSEMPDAKGLLGSVNANTAYHQREYIPYPHSGKTNQFLFFDGHIEALTKEQFKNRPRQREFWGNPDLPATP